MDGARWEGDERGEGVADATGLAPGAMELVDAMRAPNWVAEEPELHLLPHLERACASLPLELVRAETSRDGSFDVHLRWTGAAPRVAEIRAAVFALVGACAETSTYVRQRLPEAGSPPAGDVLFEVVTGFVDSDSAFAAHGHVLRIRVAEA